MDFLQLSSALFAANRFVDLLFAGFCFLLSNETASSTTADVQKTILSTRESAFFFVTDSSFSGRTGSCPCIRPSAGV